MEEDDYIQRERNRIYRRFMVGKPSARSVRTISDRNVAGIRGRFVGVFSVACLFLCKCIVSNQIAPFPALSACLMYVYIHCLLCFSCLAMIDIHLGSTNSQMVIDLDGSPFQAFPPLVSCRYLGQLVAGPGSGTATPGGRTPRGAVPKKGVGSLSQVVESETTPLEKEYHLPRPIIFSPTLQGKIPKLTHIFQRG